MNFLAHLLTGDSGDELLVGSFAGDFCRGRLDRHPAELRAGIRLHRLVDAYAEENRSFSSVRAMLRPSLGLYAAVGADMLIDHVLARHWRNWLPSETLERFASRAGSTLLASAALPHDGARVARAMVRGSWLASYATREGIATALERMTARIRGGVRLTDAMLELERNNDEMSGEIEAFLADLFAAERLIEAGMPESLGRRSR